MKEIKLNSFLKTTKVVLPEDSAIKVGSGLVDVFATPAMIALAEKTASQCLGQFLDEGEVSVGMNINIDHMAPSKIGAIVECLATIINVEGKKVTFDITVKDKDIIVGYGKHTRCVVNKEKFMSKLG